MSTLPPIEPKPVRSFDIDDHPYTDGDTMQVITPELGLLTGTIKFEDYSRPAIITMDLGWVTTPLPCRMNSRPDSPNARLSARFTRLEATRNFKAYWSNEIRLVYFCNCRTGKHTEVLVWFEVTLEGNVLRSTVIGRDVNGKPHNHPLVEGHEDLKPDAPITEPEPDERPKVDPVKVVEFMRYWKRQKSVEYFNFDEKGVLAGTHSPNIVLRNGAGFMLDWPGDHEKAVLAAGLAPQLSLF
ncbi:hypothetical protein BN8_03638 [Fibrisoma limi BUZ 3]|uniref:Uncharacterized protein n=1 Tax=Fibrisoma limi BUZ 3 TaxID=1185876 RepID=I2GKP0_9BACT|nr:hypothetical protein [Fibrisoma limi]CCH54466.1 hypothetical protein BN8_03638 [Fibrisoma limi BUZ 3]